MVNIFAWSSSSSAEEQAPWEAKDLFTSNYAGCFVLVFFNYSECTSHCWPVKQNIVTLKIDLNDSPPVLLKALFKNIKIKKWENKCHVWNTVVKETAGKNLTAYFNTSDKHRERKKKENQKEPQEKVSFFTTKQPMFSICS